MKIVSLLENTTARNDLKIEHGLSLYIEACGKKILFDFGETDLFYKNAKKLGVDLTEVDLAVLSHGHSDHGGGLSTFLNINSHAPVYISPTAFLPHYNGQGKFIGLDSVLMENERLVYVKNDKIKICIECGFTACDDCEEFKEHDNTYYCSACYNENFTTCQDCNEVFENPDTFYCDLCESRYCYNCREEHEIGANITCDKCKEESEATNE